MAVAPSMKLYIIYMGPCNYYSYFQYTAFTGNFKENDLVQNIFV